MRVFLFLLSLAITFISKSQLKYVVEDFEGFVEGNSDLKNNGLFTFGNVRAGVDCKIHNSNKNKQAYSGSKAIRIDVDGKGEYGGWGKGLSVNVELDPSSDFLNFYVKYTEASGTKIKIELQEDDNNDFVYTKEMDDSWTYTHTLESKKDWELISIPLSKFKDGNYAGNGVLM